MGEEAVKHEPGILAETAGLSLAELVQRQVENPGTLLNGDEEVVLGTAIQAGLAARSRMDAAEDIDEAQRAELETAAQDGALALSTLVNANLRMVERIAGRYTVGDTVLNRSDLRQEGFIGLFKAAKRFDPTRGCRFSSLAYPYIRRSMQRAVAEHRTGFRYPEALGLARIPYVKMTPIEEEEHTPGMEKTDPIEVEEMAYPLDLEESLIDRGDGNFQRQLESIIDTLVCQDLLRNVKLTRRETEVIMLRYGFIDGTPRTLEKVSEEIDVTRSRVGQLDQAAKDKIFVYAHKHGLRGDI